MSDFNTFLEEYRIMNPTISKKLSREEARVLYKKDKKKKKVKPVKQVEQEDISDDYNDYNDYEMDDDSFMLT